MLIHAGERVEDGAFADIGVAGKRHGGTLCIRYASVNGAAPDRTVRQPHTVPPRSTQIRRQSSSRSAMTAPRIR